MLQQYTFDAAHSMLQQFTFDAATVHLGTYFVSSVVSCGTVVLSKKKEELSNDVREQ
jgi:hypothetical protein